MWSTVFRHISCSVKASRPGPPLFALVHEPHPADRHGASAEERLKLAADAARIGIWELDIAADRLEWNEWMYHIYGVEPSTFAADYRAWEEAVHPEDRATAVAAVRETMEAGNAFDMRFRVLRADGSVRTVHARGSAISSEGRPIRMIGVNIDVTEQEAAAAQIKRLAQYDHLTGLPNRRLLLDRMRQALAHGRRSGEYGALMFLDLDNFKRVNDTAGHEAGDELLRQVAARLEDVVREADTAGGLGGEEFLVLLRDLGAVPGLAAAYARNVAGKLVAALRKPFRVGEATFRTSGSVGIVMCPPKQSDEQELMRRADLAMYKAKSRGRDSVYFFDPRLQQEVEERAALEQQLRLAVERGEFEVHFQPVCDEDGAVLGAEALLRWQHPQRGLLTPDAFLPAAEDSGLISPIGEQVLRRACRQLAEWDRSEATRHLTLSVNVSAVQLARQRFAREVLDLVVEEGVSPAKLTLEFTEGAFLDHGERAWRQLASLREAGFRLSLDDFGTGYSSLTYFRRMRFDAVKIDRCFVHDLLSDEVSAAIVEAVLHIGRIMKLEVVAEGIEVPDQLHRLIELGCRRFQGFLLAGPMPVEAFTALALDGGGTRA